MSAILFWQYLASIITIPPYIFVYLLVIKKWFEELHPRPISSHPAMTNERPPSLQP